MRRAGLQLPDDAHHLLQLGHELGPVLKASGGVRSRAEAEAMIAAGATRLELSSTRAIVNAEDAAGDY